MSIQVVRGKVDTGERVYLSGETIVGLSDKDEKELVALKVCRYVVDQPSDDSEAPKETNSEDIPEGLIKLGGGMYELPNGKKVRGKKKAIEAIGALDPDAEKEDDDPNAGPNTDLPI